MSSRRSADAAGPATRYGSAAAKGPGQTVSYGGVDAEILRDAIEAVSTLGDCLMFSRTSDGGALSLRILSDGVVEKWYPTGTDEAEVILVGIIKAAKA